MEESAKKVEKTANNNTKTKAKAKEKAKVGHGSSMFSEKIDEVSRNAIWREHCAKSTNQQIISSHYTLNPLTAIPIPEKPNRCHPSIKVTQEEYEEAKAFLGNTYTLKNTDLTPPEKYEVPITTSHEYGWCSKPLVEPNEISNFPHSSCAITKFAAKYQELMHTTAFSKKDFVPRSKKKVVDAPGTGSATIAVLENQSDSAKIPAGIAYELTPSQTVDVLPQGDIPPLPTSTNPNAVPQGDIPPLPTSTNPNAVFDPPVPSSVA